MNLRTVDLNLLVILDVLLQEGHVSRAAKRLCLSQPATSSALDRCRQLFNDPLLLRVKSGMQLTPKAEALRAQLKEVLRGIHQVLEVDEQDLSEVRQTVRISLSDSILLGLAESLHHQLSSAAPGVTLIFVAWHGPGQALDGLAKGDVDLAVSQFPQVGASIHRRSLAHEDYRMLMRKGHPVANNFNLDTWLEWPHIMVSGRGEMQSSVDQILLGLGRSRTVGMIVPSFIVVPHLVQHSNMIAMLPSPVIPPKADKHFVVCDPPVEVEGYSIHLAWHARQSSDRTIRYIAELIESYFKGAATQPGHDKNR